MLYTGNISPSDIEPSSPERSRQAYMTKLRHQAQFLGNITPGESELYHGLMDGSYDLDKHQIKDDRFSCGSCGSWIVYISTGRCVDCQRRNQALYDSQEG